VATNATFETMQRLMDMATASYFDAVEATIQAQERALKWGQSYLDQVKNAERDARKISEEFVALVKRSQNAWYGWWQENARFASEYGQAQMNELEQKVNELTSRIDQMQREGSRAAKA
jgi:hypothetical protein